ncbi:MAG: HAD hydrolase-like protein [Rhodothermales bacterium]|nr:HAD hydrolase-like protein [Rhodothermales bacterium]
MKLLLFDIDGTMLFTRGVGRRAMERSIQHLIGRPVTTQGVDFSGRTDPQIMRDILLLNGVPDAEVEGLLTETLTLFVEHFSDLITPGDTTMLPGVDTLVKRLAERDDVQLALLTGNLQPTAYLKVGAIGLAEYFPFGAFGSDHADRYQLTPFALDRAEAHTSRRFEGKDVVIIGDTKHDILCGRSLNVFSVAVCTGHHTRDFLVSHGPDLMLEDLSDADAFIEQVVLAS